MAVMKIISETDVAAVLLSNVCCLKFWGGSTYALKARFFAPVNVQCSCDACQWRADELGILWKCVFVKPHAKRHAKEKVNTDTTQTAVMPRRNAVALVYGGSQLNVRVCACVHSCGSSV